jgi:hypothetical protein
VTKTKKSHELVFKGFWQFDSKNRFTYILEGSPLASFSFRAQLESPNLYPADNVIKYRIGVGLARRFCEKQKIISLYGQWKISRSYAAAFEMEYAGGCLHRMEFGTTVSFNKENEVTFSLTNQKNEALGVSLTYSHSFLKNLDAKAFLRLRKSSGEAAVEAGIRIPF